MAAINSEQQEFALHSLNDEYKNKTFFFVKLTDSALKSIEDYMSLTPNLRQGIAKPTIQFQSDSNQGAITLPLSTSNAQQQNSKNEIRYSFNLSNVDADGPQGSFEILRQRKLYRFEECMESLGSMFIKMQFHASDDIYQKTKVKMANAKKDAKKHSTKVIKETGPNVGRKIKKTITGTGGSTSTNGNTTNEQSNAYSSYKDMLNVNCNFVDLNSHSPKPHTSSKFLSNGNHSKSINNSSANLILGKDDQSMPNSIINNHQVTSKESGSSQQQQNSSSLLNQSKSNSSSSANHLSNSNGSIANQTVQPPNPEILRKPIRDRIIHLLALRPYKKPELHAKLNRDGLREKDKKGLGALLGQIANLKDNAYHLHRGAWHEVQTDDWPFYTADERELVRKRNPLSISGSTSTHANQSNSNLTTDLNSAINSSISPIATFDNQQQQKSPLMHHLNSPSATNKRTIEQSAAPNGGPNIISAVDYDYATANKKQRISHHKANSEQTKKRSPPLLVNGNLSNNCSNNLSSNQSSQPFINGSSTSRSTTLVHSNGNTLTNNSISNGSKTIGASNKLTNKYDDVINIWENKPKTPDEPSQTNGHYSNNNNSTNAINHNQVNSHSSPEINSSVNSSNGLVNNKMVGSTVDRKVASVYRNANHNQTSDRYHSHFATFTNHHAYNNSNQPHNSSLCSTPNSSPDSGTGSNDGSLASTSSSRSSNSTNEDYLSKYTEITSVDQFRKYKQDFNCEYEEYKKLHNIVDRNANKFALLEQELRQAQEGTETWNHIMENILHEYEEIKRDSTYLNARSRMQYLHTKLSHIKSLILNYTNQSQYRKHGHSSSTSIKFNNTSNGRIRSRNHSSLPVQQSS